MKNLILTIVLLLSAVSAEAQITERYEYSIIFNEQGKKIGEEKEINYVTIDFDRATVSIASSSFIIRSYELFETYLVMYLAGGTVYYYRDIGVCQVVTDTGGFFLLDFNYFNYQELPLGKEKLIESGTLKI